jgi:hypothetical protein
VQGPALNGIIYVKGRKPSSVATAGATTAGLEATTSTRRKGRVGADMLDGIIYAKGRKPSSAGMAGATTAGLERLEVAAGLEAGGGGGSEGRRRVSLVQLSSVVLR